MSLSSEHLSDDYAAIPPLVKSIEPSYNWYGCDCEQVNWALKAQVLAFDPVP